MLVEKAVKLALRLGASEAEAYLVQGRDVQVQFNAEDKNIKTVNSNGIGVRVAFGKRLGMYSNSIINESEVEAAVKRAVRIAKAAPEDPDWVSFNQEYGFVQVSDIYDDSIVELGPKELVERVDSAIKVIRDYDSKVVPSKGILTAAHEKVTLTNSSQEESIKRGTMIFGVILANASEGEKRCNGSEFDSSKLLSAFNYDDVAQKASEMAVNFLDAEQVKGGDMPVIFKNKVFGSIIDVMLSSAINADSVQKGSSPLAGKIGEQISSDIVQIYDDGRLNGGINSSPFDDEGHPTQRTPIIMKGVLKNYLYDHYTAVKDETESTGNGSRAGYRSTVSPSTSNIILEESKTDVEKLVEDTKKGLFVESVIGEWLSNPISGELNATVTHGYMIKNGELGQPVKGLVIAGNFYEVLKTKIEGIANDIVSNNGVYSPTVKVTELSIAGK